VHVAGTQSTAFEVAKLVEHEQRVIAGAGVMAVPDFATGNDMTRRFPLIVDAIARLRSRSCIVDGEAVACDETELLRSISSGTTELTTACSSTPLT
jgi:hypothetical protein